MIKGPASHGPGSDGGSTPRLTVIWVGGDHYFDRKTGRGQGVPTLPPVSAKRLFFCMAILHGMALCFAWSLLQRKNYSGIFIKCSRSPEPGAGGEGGTPLLGRHMGGRVIPSLIERRGGGVGGYPPPPLSCELIFFCTAKTIASRGISGGEPGFPAFSRKVAVRPAGR